MLQNVSMAPSDKRVTGIRIVPRPTQPHGEQYLDSTAIYRIYRIALGKDQRPDPWQRALMEDEWPQVLIAPTGSGKTAAVTLGWAAHRLRSPNSTPRRLVWCLPMRTLVEQTADVVRHWFGRLAADAPDLTGLPGPEDIHVLMGGVEAGDWLAKPECPAVLVGTQDMLLSRALMRGYAASRTHWPMEFALLHADAQWVFDEVQLMGAGRATSAQLEAFRQCEAARAARTHRANGHPARSLWISATLEPVWLKTVDHAEPPPESVVRVRPGAVADGRLARLANAEKVLHRSNIALASPKSDDVERYIKELAESILDAHRPGYMTLVIVNRVARAQKLHKEVERLLQQHESPPPALALVHSRFRRAERVREMKKVVGGASNDVIVVATQAIEAGVDISAAVLFTELAPWSSLVQRFGRANRYAELDGGADIYWIDLLGEVDDGKAVSTLALPYTAEELRAAREQLKQLVPPTSAAPANLPPASDVDPPRRVIRRKDLDDLFDTDPDLTGFDVDVSPYVRDADDTDIRIFWRNLRDRSRAVQVPPRPHGEELCAAPIGSARDWLRKARRKRSGNLVFVRDPQQRLSEKGAAGEAPPGWRPFWDDPWPGMTLLVDTGAGGYDESIGFTGNPKDVPAPITGSPDPTAASASSSGTDEEGHNEDPRSAIGVPVPLTDHLDHVAAEAEALCHSLDVDAETHGAIVRAARWHDLGKAHEVFQDTMRRGLPGGPDAGGGRLLAKTVGKNMRHGRTFFRHELASALAFLDHEHWSRDADLVAYLIAAHHGKVRMNLRALPREWPPKGERAGSRFARGIWEGDELPSIDLGAGERWAGGCLTLSIMELGWDEATRESWTERTRDLLERFGPFRLAWMETIVRLADWRASAKEQEGSE